MELWTQWLNVIHSLLIFLSSGVGFGTGLGIVVLTVLLRTVILPVSWPIAYRGSIRQKKMLRLQPELARLKLEYGKEPRLYAERVMQLYQDNGMTGPGSMEPASYGWKPWRVLIPYLPFVAALTTMLMMAANPDLPEQMRLILILVPSILATIMALKFCSALAVYWTVSNFYSAIQTGALHYVIARRVRSGAVKI